MKTSRNRINTYIDKEIYDLLVLDSKQHKTKLSKQVRYRLALGFDRPELNQTDILKIEKAAYQLNKFGVLLNQALARNSEHHLLNKEDNLNFLLGRIEEILEAMDKLTEAHHG